MQPPLISAEACEQLQLVKRMFALDRSAYTRETKESLLEKYPEVFEGLGCLPGKCTIEIDSTVKPVQQAPRRVPVHLKERLKEKIEELEKKAVICRVDRPTEWISNIVIVSTKEKLRICLDPVDLNRAIRPPSPYASV